MEQNDDLVGITDVQDDPLLLKASSLPSDHQFPSIEGTTRSSTTSDEETDVGFMNKTRSFPDLSAHAQQQALAIKEAKLRKREEAIQRKEFHLQYQQSEALARGYTRMYGEQPLYSGTAGGGGGYSGGGGTGGGYNWSGGIPYTGQHSSQAPAATYIYHHNEQQWSRPHGEC